MRFEDKRLFTKARRFIVTHAHSIREIHGFEMIKDASILRGILGDVIDEAEHSKAPGNTSVKKDVEKKSIGRGLVMVAGSESWAEL